MKFFVFAAAMAAFVCGTALSGPASAAKRVRLQGPAVSVITPYMPPSAYGSAAGPGGY